MKDNYNELLKLYMQNAPSHKKLKRDIVNAAIINKQDSNELSCTIRLLKLAIFSTQGRRKYYYRYFKSDIRSKAIEIVYKMLYSSPLQFEKGEIQAYLFLLSCNNSGGYLTNGMGYK